MLSKLTVPARKLTHQRWQWFDLCSRATLSTRRGTLNVALAARAGNSPTIALAQNLPVFALAKSAGDFPDITLAARGRRE